MKLKNSRWTQITSQTNSAVWQLKYIRSRKVVGAHLAYRKSPTISQECTPAIYKNFSKNFTIMCTSAFNSDVRHRFKCPPLLALRFDCKPLDSAHPQRSLLLNHRVLCIYTSSNGFVLLYSVTSVSNIVCWTLLAENCWYIFTQCSTKFSI